MGTRNARAVTGLTDCLLAGGVLFLAGMFAARPKEAFSAAWYWSWFLLLVGVAALLGAIDHGFIEPAGLPRFWIQRLNWLVLAAVTACVLLSTAKQFLPQRFQLIGI